MYEDEVQSIAIHVVPCELIVAKITDSRKLALLALEIGNLHLPAQVEKDEIAFIEDGPVMEVLDTMQIPWTKQHRRFDPAQVISVPSVDLSPALRTIIRSQPQTPRGLAAPAGSPPGANERP
jgi:urease accessory protein UreE